MQVSAQFVRNLTQVLGSHQGAVDLQWRLPWLAGRLRSHPEEAKPKFYEHIHSFMIQMGGGGGVLKNQGHHIGVLVIRESYNLVVYIRGFPNIGAPCCGPYYKGILLVGGFILVPYFRYRPCKLPPMQVSI